MRTVSAFLALALLAFFISSCAQPTGPAASGHNGFRSTPPPSSSSNFNLATPVLSGSQTGAGEISLSWPNGRTEGSILPGGQYYPIDWTGANVANGVKPGSEHTEIYWLVDGEWVLYGEHVGQDLTITGLADDTYSFYVKEKSKENATGQGTETFHSQPSNVIEVEVSTCEHPYAVTTAEQPNWNATHQTGYVANSTIIRQKTNSNANSRKFNFHFNLEVVCGNFLASGHTVTVQVNGASVHNASESLLVPGRYEVNGVTYPNTTGDHVITILVDGDEIYPPGSWICRVF